MNNRIEFIHQQTEADTLILKSICSHIYSVSRILIWSCFSMFLFIGIILGINDETQTYGVPLAILAGFLFVGTLILLLYFIHSRPLVLMSIENNTDVSYKLTFRKENFSISKSGQYHVTLPYKQLIGQYWYENYYILHARIPSSNRHSQDELYIIHLTEESFDSVYILADALIHLKKRLIHIKGKKNKHG